MGTLSTPIPLHWPLCRRLINFSQPPVCQLSTLLDLSSPQAGGSGTRGVKALRNGKGDLRPPIGTIAAGVEWNVGQPETRSKICRPKSSTFFSHSPYHLPAACACLTSTIEIPSLDPFDLPAFVCDLHRNPATFAPCLFQPYRNPCPYRLVSSSITRYATITLEFPFLSQFSFPRIV